MRRVRPTEVRQAQFFVRDAGAPVAEVRTFDTAGARARDLAARINRSPGREGLSGRFEAGATEGTEETRVGVPLRRKGGAEGWPEGSLPRPPGVRSPA